jgi:hypothetical protein
MKDTLFVLRPGFQDKDQVWFCPYSAQVIGYLSYYPGVRETLELVELEFPKPREPLASLVGEDHQAAPLLVLGGEAADVGVPVGEAKGHRFVEKTMDILRYLARTRGTPDPH